MTSSPLDDDSAPVDRNDLPPVEPPTAGFIIQLFVIPAVIVVIVVMVSLMFNWLAHRGSDPAEYVQTIEMGRLDAWQAAHDLATELSREPRLRSRDDLAVQINDLLLARLNEPRPSSTREQESYDNLIYFLCSALGQFRTPDAAPGLLAAAGTAWPGEPGLRLNGGALESLALLAHSCQTEGTPLTSHNATDVVLKLSRHKSGLIRRRAAYALGVLGGQESTSRLEALLNDADPNVRFNAAAGLSRWKNTEAVNREVVDVLLQMLDLESGGYLEDVPNGHRPESMKVLVVKNGLRSAVKLAAANSDLKTDELVQSILELRENVDSGGIPPESNASIGVEIRQALRELQPAQVRP